MSDNKRSRSKNLIIGFLVFLIVFVIVFLGVQWITKTGLFKIPGIVYYDDSLTDSEKELFSTIFTEEVTLDKDVTISAKDYLILPELANNEYLYSISVPVTDFYSLDDNINIESPELLFADPYISDVAFSMIDINDLDFTKKLLSINSNNYLDSFDSGAVFRIVSFESEKFDEEIEPLVSSAMKKSFPNKSNVLTMAQTGVTALSRGMNEKLYNVGDATYFAEGIKDYLSSFDLTHTSNESSFSDFASSSNICSDPRFIDTLTAIGLDIVELTGNHNVDCGDESARSTIDTYLENGIKIVGGGKTASEAAVPLSISEKGNNITMFAYNLSTGGATLDETPGANQYIEEAAASEISSAKERGDFVIVDIQYYECSAYVSEVEDTTCDYADSSAGDQIGFFRHLIDLGADVVVGTSAHQPQTFELYGNGAIYYGLGNLFFDQVWWPGTTRSLVLEHYFYNNKLLSTRVTPTVYDYNLQTNVMDGETAKWFLQRLISVRP